MRGVSTVLVLLALTGVLLTIGPAVERSMAAAQLPQDTPLPDKNPIPTSPESIRAGALVFAANCRPCHGPTGKGDGVDPPPGSHPANLTDDEWIFGGTDPEIFKTVKQGVPPAFQMSPWSGKIADTDIWNVINFLRDLNARAKARATAPAAAPAPPVAAPVTPPEQYPADQ